MNYWIDEYESSSTDIPTPYKSEVIKRCKEILRSKSTVRLGYVILDELQLRVHKSDAVDIIASFLQTGKHRVEIIKTKDGMDDFLIMKKPWSEGMPISFHVVKTILSHIVIALITYLLTKKFG